MPNTLKLPLPFLVFLLVCAPSFAQDSDDKKTTSKDTFAGKLPFVIAAEKRLSDDDLKEKKEGWHVTGEPDLSSDPEHGFGAGAELQLFFAGKRTDPFFAYTPYRSQIDI